MDYNLYVFNSIVCCSMSVGNNSFHFHLSHIITSKWQITFFEALHGICVCSRDVLSVMPDEA